MTHSEGIRLSESAEMKFDATFSYEEAKVLESKLRQDREDRRPFLNLSYQHAELSALGETLAVREDPRGQPLRQQQFCSQPCWRSTGKVGTMRKPKQKIQGR
jgi:hypothetical protein